MAYDSISGYSILFGGQSQKNDCLADTWIYSERNWKQCSKWFWEGPSPRCGHAMAFDESMGATVMFGGISGLNQSLDDTWIFQRNRWKRLRCPAPGPRRYAAFAYHPGLKGCVLHGGALDDEGRTKCGDTWLFRDEHWSHMDHVPETVARDDHGLVFNHTLGKMFMIGGLLPYGESQVRVLTETGWRSVDAVEPIPRFQCSQLAYDDTLRGIVLHGGEAGHQGAQSDATWFLSSGQNRGSAQ